MWLDRRWSVQIVFPAFYFVELARVHDVSDEEIHEPGLDANVPGAAAAGRGVHAGQAAIALRQCHEWGRHGAAQPRRS